VRRCLLCGHAPVDAGVHDRVVTTSCSSCQAILVIEFNPPDQPGLRARIDRIPGSRTKRGAEVQTSSSRAFKTSRGDLVSQPIEPGWIKEGRPVARAVTLSESSDKRLTIGLWDCTAGTFTWIFGTDEIVHVIEGEVRVHEGRTTHLLVPGSVCHFPAGLETIWEVPRYVKKTFILRAPHRSPARRAASSLKQGLIALMGRTRVAAFSRYPFLLCSLLEGSAPWA
jgi:uncharacterized cupin superfamily protein